MKEFLTWFIICGLCGVIGALIAHGVATISGAVGEDANTWQCVEYSYEQQQCVKKQLKGDL